IYRDIPVPPGHDVLERILCSHATIVAIYMSDAIMAGLGVPTSHTREEESSQDAVHAVQMCPGHASRADAAQPVLAAPTAANDQDGRGDLYRPSRGWYGG